MPRLSDQDRERAIGRLQVGDSPSVVANAFNVAVSTITRLWIRFQTNGSTRDNLRSGRPRVTTARQDRQIVGQHRRDPFCSATETARTTIGSHGRPVSGETVRRRLRQRGLNCRRPAVRPILTRRHRQQRLAWTQHRRNWTWRQWRNILFSDESRYCISQADGRIRVWRRTGERYNDQNILEVDAWGGPSIMIWGAIGLRHLLGPVVFRDIGQGRGNGVNAQRYIDQVLAPMILPHFQRHPHLVLQHDNARAHSARATVDYLQQQNIRVLPWPSMSPDLNPIEHLWDHLQRQLNAMNPRPADAQQLEQCIRQAWQAVNMPTVNRLIHSMPRRCQAVIDARGGHTQY